MAATVVSSPIGVKITKSRISLVVDAIASHRNGICGAPFYVVTFRFRVGGRGPRP